MRSEGTSKNAVAAAGEVAGAPDASRPDAATSGHEQRREPRLPVDTGIEVCVLRDEQGEASDESDCSHSRAFNLSTGGLGAMVDRQMVVGTVVAVRIGADLVRNEPSLRVGVVRHCTASENAGWFAVGVQYLGDADLAREARERFCDDGRCNTRTDGTDRTGGI